MSPKEFPDYIKNKLRKTKSGKLVNAVRKIVVVGCTHEPAIDQFDSDDRWYNLYEAILYVESYQKQGFYNEATTDSICKYINENYNLITIFAKHFNQDLISYNAIAPGSIICIKTFRDGTTEEFIETEVERKIWKDWTVKMRENS